MTSRAKPGRATGHTLWCAVPVDPSEREKLGSLVREGALTGFVWQAERLVKLLERGVYDDDLRDLEDQSSTAQTLALMVHDAQDACGLLEQMAESSDGADGIVSVPLVRESDGESWLAAAKRLTPMLDCPNVAFAIVADEEGLEAIADLIAAGYRTDVVGVVTCDQLRKTDEAYVKGLSRRLDQGLPLEAVGSTVEMPIATIDNAINTRLDAFAIEEDPIPPDESEIDKPWPGEGRMLRGEVAVAYAKLCYAQHQERVTAGEFARLIGLGAHPQRIRFAELTNIDPPVVYAGELSGPGVVLTVTLDNLDMITGVDSGRGSANGVEQAAETLERLADINQDLDGALVEAFDAAASSQAEAWRRAVAAVAKRVETLHRQP